eukprot:jgi/Chlat1/800/Chrsp104S01262
MAIATAATALSATAAGVSPTVAASHTSSLRPQLHKPSRLPLRVCGTAPRKTRHPLRIEAAVGPRLRPQQQPQPQRRAPSPQPPPSSSRLHSRSAVVVAPAPTTADQQAQMRRNRIVVIATDHSAESRYALFWALDNICRDQDRVVCLHVQTPFKAAYYSSGNKVTELQNPELEQALLSFADEASDSLIEELYDACHSRNVMCDVLLEKGNPRDAIVDVVEQLAADLLVVGSRGFGQQKRATLGSVSDYCVHHCPIPVVVVKMPRDQQRRPSSPGNRPPSPAME